MFGSQQAARDSDPAHLFKLYVMLAPPGYVKRITSYSGKQALSALDALCAFRSLYLKDA